MTRAALAVALSAALCAPALAASHARRARARPPFRKVMIVVFENTDASDALAQPFFRSFASSGAYLADYYAIRHPSQPNYVALVSGGTQGVHDDFKVDIAAPSLATLLNRKHSSWKVYAEGYPGHCDLSMRIGRYVRRHNPLASFASVQQNPADCAKLVNADRLDADLKAERLPDFSLYIPNLDDDGHDTSAAYADAWFARRFGPLLARWPHGALLAVTFDEDSNRGGPNRVYTALRGDMVRRGAVSKRFYNHYSLLRTVEDGLGLGTLGLHDASAAPITGVWKRR